MTRILLWVWYRSPPNSRHSKKTMDLLVILSAVVIFTAVLIFFVRGDYLVVLDECFYDDIIVKIIV